MKRLIILATLLVFLLTTQTPAFALDDYPDFLKKKELDEVIDPWSFYNRECTSFVAWCLNSRNGVSFDNFYKGVQWGNAVDWVDAARQVGVRVDKTPAVGSVAWWGGEYGHVAYVVDIDSDSVTVEEYNSYKPGQYAERSVRSKNVDQFIHFGGTDDFLKGRVSWAKNVSYKRDEYFKGSYTGKMKFSKPTGEGYILFDADSGIQKERGALSYKGNFEDGYPMGKGSMQFEDREESGTYYGPFEPGKIIFKGSEDYHSGLFRGFMHSYSLKVKDNHNLEYLDEEWYKYYERIELTNEEAEAMKKDRSLFEKKFGEMAESVDGSIDDNISEDGTEETADEKISGKEQASQEKKDGLKERNDKVEDKAKKLGHSHPIENTVNENGFFRSYKYKLGQFSDVIATDWFEPWVAKASEYGFVKGASDGNFHPMGEISYAQLITIASRMHSIYYNNTIEERSGSEWYMTYVNYAMDHGIIDRGYVDGEMMKEKVNRSDSIGILGRALPQTAFVSQNNVENSAIPDVKMTDANSSPIYSFYRAGILSGLDAEGRFHPLKHITRAEISKIVVCMVEEESRKKFQLLYVAE